jgi:hypothetical protein
MEEMEQAQRGRKLPVRKARKLGEQQEEAEAQAGTTQLEQRQDLEEVEGKYTFKDTAL